MVPIIDDSEIHLDFNVVSGKLENFGPMKYLADILLTKMLQKCCLIRFKIIGGSMNIPT